MLWHSAFVGAAGIRPVVDSAIPALANPVWVLDTSQLGMFYTDTAGTVQATGAGNIARIANGLGGAAHWLQADNAQRPYIVLNALGSKPGLRFDGPGRNMYLAGMTDPGSLFQARGFTMLMVTRIAARPTWAAHFSAGNSTGGANNGGFDTLLVEANANGWPRLFRAGGSDVGQVAPANAAYTGDNQIWKTVFRSSRAEGMEIRTKSASGNFVGTGAGPTSEDSFPWNAAYLGAELGQGGSNPPQYPFVGDIFEFRFWNGRASDADFAQLQGYADLKYGG